MARRVRWRSVVLVAALLWIDATAAPGQSLAPRRPNILLAIADDASWPHMSAYGCRFLRTPNFDRVATEGVLFNNCFTPTPKCSPSRAALLTGRNPWQLEEAANHYGIFPAKFKVFPDLLESGGYFVGFTGKGWGPGDWRKGGRTRNPAGPLFDGATLDPPTTGISPQDYAANFRKFLDARPKDKPFCFWYGGHEPHRKYEPGSGVKSGKKLSDVTLPPYFPDSDVIRSDVLDYALEIEWFDAQLGRILKILEDSGELDNTLVLVTADNGMPFPRVKGHIYEDACHLPLAVRWPAGGVKGGRTVDDFISFIDVAPTLLEAAGVPQSAETTGRSFVDVLKAEAPAGQIDPSRSFVLLGRERCDLGRPGDVGFPVRAIRTKQFFYARNFAPDRWPAGNPETGFTDIDDSPTKSLIVARGPGDKYWDLALARRGPEELYDVQKDPACVTDLAADPAHADAKGRLWSDLQTALRQQQDPRLLGHGDVFDEYKSTAPRNRSWDAITGAKRPATQPSTSER